MSARRSQGFTLIEMVVAFAILGIALTTLYAVFESALSRIRHDTHLSESILLAQSLLARAGTEWPLAEGVRHGDWQNYRYELAEQGISALDGQPPYTLPAIQVTASVSWVESAGKRTIVLSTLKLLPQVAP